ncbi:ATP phosphoribosyltransferase [Candidatus Micrarchaeota archaeon]|nr:ATP phosphoribosyltransferase [Candidatus Micrarchaeota archaeon]
MIRIAVPNKGRLSEPSLELMAKAGMKVKDSGDKKLYAKTSDANVEVVFARAEDIPRYVETGAVEFGITGSDLVAEEKAKVDVIVELGFGKCRLMVAVPDNSGITKLSQLNGKKVATSFGGIVKDFFKRKGVRVEVVEVAGAVEVTPYRGVADAIADLVDTGITLKTHGLATIETIFESSACFIGTKKSVSSNKDFVEETVFSFNGIMAAEGKRYLMVNVKNDSALKRVVKVIPCMESPTVLPLAKKGEYAVHAVVNAGELASAVRKIKQAGGKDILVMRMERVVP